jgi:fumarate reductase subunit C
MSVWFLIALVAYLLGAIVQWLQLRRKFEELDEYVNSPIVSIVKLIRISSCLIEALTWPCSLIMDDELIHQKSLKP